MTSRPRILVVEDDPLFAAMLLEALAGSAYDTTHAETAAEALATASRREYDAALLDVRLPDADDLSLFRALRERQPRCSALVMTGHASVEAAVEAMREGASDYLAKPFPTEMLLLKLERLFRARRTEEELAALRARAPEEGFVGRSRKVLRLLETARSVAATDATVLVQGESGTGKELVAELLHRHSPRQEGPLVKVNCGAVPETLMESELFGHEKGAFTGAERRRKGVLEQASGGTLFLDEVGEISSAMQVKLLRALQDRRIRRLGGEEEISVDFRLVAATNRHPQELLRSGDLREDFYFRLSVVPISVPPLRERADDIPLLLEHFVRRYSRSHGLDPVRFSAEAVEALLAHPWPGNVRELQNLVERLQVLHPGAEIRPRDLPAELRAKRPAAGMLFAAVPTRLLLREAVGRFERQFIDAVVEEEGGNKAAAARRLGVARETLWKKAQA
ncbi:MAG: sigma-54 dependent transcriptional regulator [Thermodesulfobacteriota bacterium]